MSNMLKISEMCRKSKLTSTPSPLGSMVKRFSVPNHSSSTKRQSSSHYPSDNSEDDYGTPPPTFDISTLSESSLPIVPALSIDASSDHWMVGNPVMRPYLITINNDGVVPPWGTSNKTQREHLCMVFQQIEAYHVIDTSIVVTGSAGLALALWMVGLCYPYTVSDIDVVTQRHYVSCPSNMTFKTGHTCITHHGATLHPLDVSNCSSEVSNSFDTHHIGLLSMDVVLPRLGKGNDLSRVTDDNTWVPINGVRVCELTDLLKAYKTFSIPDGMTINDDGMKKKHKLSRIKMDILAQLLSVFSDLSPNPFETYMSKSRNTKSTHTHNITNVKRLTPSSASKNETNVSALATLSARRIKRLFSSSCSSQTSPNALKSPDVEPPKRCRLSFDSNSKYSECYDDTQTSAMLLASPHTPDILSTFIDSTHHHDRETSAMKSSPLGYSTNYVLEDDMSTIALPTRLHFNSSITIQNAIK